MPLAFRTIQPEWLGRRPLNEEEASEDVALTAVCQNALLGAIIQLASLIRHADDLFCDLAEECQKVFEKTECITAKIKGIQLAISKLDPNEVKIPLGSLSQFSAITDHHVANHGFDCDLFTPSNRPYCIRFNYSLCETTPVHVLRGVDQFRKDGLTSTVLFKLWPVALKDLDIHMDDISLPRQFSSAMAQKRKYKPLQQKARRRTIHSIQEILEHESSCDLPAKTDHLSKSQPSILVSVDTSGSGFERMALFRQSLKEEVISRKKRRRTTSEIPDCLIQEAEHFASDRRIPRDRPRRYSLDDLDQTELDARDEVMQQFLQEMDSAIAEREEEAYADRRQTKLLKFIPCRRSRSLPRCLKLLTLRRHDEMTLSSVLSKTSLSKIPDEEEKAKPLVEVPSQPVKLDSSASFGSLSGAEDGAASKSGRSSSKRSSLIGDKIKSLVSGTLRPRPKSLDLDSVETVAENGRSKQASKTSSRSVSLTRVNSPGPSAEGTMTRTTSEESQVGPGSYYYFDSNTLPRAQAKKYDFPWDSLPKDWTTSVKLREISKRRKEDRQSSSGNWSQSGYSSNRQSLDSDAKSSKRSTFSQNSLGRDSGRGSPRSMGDRDCLDTGYMGDAASLESVSDTKSVSNTDSDEWIRTLAEQAAQRGDVTSTSAEALASLSRLTKQSIRNLDLLVPRGRAHFRQSRHELEDDGESSVYSLDQEGFYTSFHTDSGLRRSTTTLLNDEDEDLMMPRNRETESNILSGAKHVLESDSPLFGTGDKDFDQSFNLTSTLKPKSINSKLPTDENPDFDIQDLDFQDEDDRGIEYGQTGTLKPKKKSGKTKTPPPPPPPRSTSMRKSERNNQKGSVGVQKSLDDDSNYVGGSSPESSDQETVYARLKMKTSISAQTFPSWCSGGVSDEDDFQDRLNAESSEVEELFSGRDSWLAGTGTLPRVHFNPKNNHPTAEADPSSNNNSWPRIRRGAVSSAAAVAQQSGILKTPDKEKVKLNPNNPKVINFDPIVNLFDARSPHGVKLPLSRLSSSEDSSSPDATSPIDTHPPGCLKAGPMKVRSEQTITVDESVSPAEVSSQGLPSSTVSRAANIRPRSMFLHPSELGLSSTPTHAHKPGKDDFFSQDLSGGIPAISSPAVDTLGSLSSSLHGTPLSAQGKAELTLNSNSTIALSDIDSSSLTYVTMSDSSPSGSALSLNWDTDDTPNPTPTSTPVRQSSSSASTSMKKYARESNENTGLTDGNTNSSVPHVSSKEYCSSVTAASVKLNDPENTVKNFPRLHPPTNDSAQAKTDSFNSLSQTNNAKFSINPNHLTHTVRSKESPIQTLLSVAHDESAQNPQQNVCQDGKFTFTLDNNHNQQCSYNQTEAGFKNVSQSERRRSSPLLSNSRQPTIPANSNNNTDQHPIVKGGNNTDFRRRRSDNFLYSPVDSGYGSPLAVNQPNAPVQSFSYSPTQTNLPGQSIFRSQNNSNKAANFTPANNETSTKDAYGPLSETATSSISKTVSPTTFFDHHAIRRRDSNQSNASLNSQFSVSSTQQLLPSAKKSDISKSLHRENSDESVHSSGSSGRSDSYRAAMIVENSDEAKLLPNSASNLNSYFSGINPDGVQKDTLGKHRSQQCKSWALPPSAMYSDDVVGRADSYRCAVRNTQSLMMGDASGRNTSYRLATCEEDVVITDNRMEACNLWTGKTGGTRDLRRMGITDVDQLKVYSSDKYDGDKSSYRKNVSKSSNTLHVKKKLATKVEPEETGNGARSSPLENRKLVKSASKDKSRQKTQSSTYIRFDPIFESGEDLRASSESLRPPSIISMKTLVAKVEARETTTTSENSHLIGSKQGQSSTGSPVRKRSSSLGRKEDKVGLSIFGSLKTTIRSIGGTKGGDF